ncbi:MAG: membrane protein insertion efficiency factor YidD [Dehalococcoidia bacterium]|nr:membrane protein insertion efficiency factor YidD [Dehalococcoidia bacterium]
MRLVVAAIRTYQRTVSEVTPHRCRFQPTCSEYMLEAVERYGVAKGVWLGLKRLVRCHPFSQVGYDPVPKIGESCTQSR